jgi:hypothetical protein
MRTEYRILLTTTFDNSADRDTWYTALKAAVVTLKGTNPAYRASNITKDDYAVTEPATEPI